MKHSAQTLVQLHAFLMDLYPRTYHVECGEEQRIMFSRMVREAARRGGLSPVWVSLRELRYMPGGIILEHWRERRNQSMATGRKSPVTFEPGSRYEAVAGLAPFLLLRMLPTTLNLLRVYMIEIVPSARHTQSPSAR